MRVAAIVVAYNSAGDFPESLACLARLPLDRTLVVDNASTDGSATIATAYTPYVLPSANAGFGAAVNAAAESHDADAFLLLNPDCQISAEDFALLAKALDDDPALGAVAPSMRYPDGRYGIAAGPEPSMAKEWLAALRVDQLVPMRVKRRLLRSAAMRSRVRMLDYLATEPTGQTRRVAWVSGYCMLLRATAFRQVGGFDPDYFLYFEDTDICRRLRNRGWDVGLVGTSVADHKESTSTSTVGKRALYRSGMVVYFTKHGTRRQRLLARALRRLPI